MTHSTLKIQTEIRTRITQGNRGGQRGNNFCSELSEGFCNRIILTKLVCFIFLQRCPPSSLDICLIGMYPFSGSQYVLATEERVVLLTRASHNALHRSKR